MRPAATLKAPPIMIREGAVCQGISLVIDDLRGWWRIAAATGYRFIASNHHQAWGTDDTLLCTYSTILYRYLYDSTHHLTGNRLCRYQVCTVHMVVPYHTVCAVFQFYWTTTVCTVPVLPKHMTPHMHNSTAADKKICCHHQLQN